VADDTSTSGRPVRNPTGATGKATIPFVLQTKAEGSAIASNGMKLSSPLIVVLVGRERCDQE
jgi:hypothetical protein